MANSVTVTREIIAEPEQVWRVLTDLDNSARVLGSVEKIERVSGEGYGPGVRWLETRKVFGKFTTEEMWVEETEPPFRTVVKSEAQGTVFTTVFACKPSSLGTTLEATFSAQPGNQSAGQKLLSAVFSNAGLKATKSVLEGDLSDIAAVLR